jgi:hypothetical protein
MKGTTPDGGVMPETGWIVPKGYVHVMHGYATTGHASQGKAVDRVFIAQSAESMRASSQEQFYVGVSRGRRSVTVFTDDKKELYGAVRRSGERRGAHDLAPDEDQSARGDHRNQWKGILTAYQRPGKGQAEPERDQEREHNGEMEPVRE